jgi:multidrug efflux system membrane fusion protein
MAFVGVVLLALVFFVVRARTSSKGAAAGKPAPSGSAGPEDRVVPVTAAKVELRDLPIYLEGLGTVTALNTVTIKSQVEGRLDEILFKEGQDVKKGDVLARIDPRPFAIQLEQAQAAQARDGVTLKNAKATLDRTLGLLANGLATQQQADDQKAQVGTAEAAVRADQAAISSATLELDYARIKSPIDGVTGVRLVDAGNIVHPTDANGIVVITQLDPVAVFFTLPEEELPRVSKELAKRKLTVEAYARDGTTKLGEGEVLLVDNQINQQTATIRLKATLRNPDRQLWPNQFVKARMLLRTQERALVIPSEAIVRGPKGSIVYVIGKDDTVKPRPVEIDAVEGDITIVRSGLEAGERVVTEGQNQLKPGAKVATKGKGAPGASSAAPADGSAAPSGGAPPPADTGSATPAASASGAAPAPSAEQPQKGR